MKHIYVFLLTIILVNANNISINNLYIYKTNYCIIYFNSTVYKNIYGYDKDIDKLIKEYESIPAFYTIGEINLCSLIISSQALTPIISIFSLDCIDQPNKYTLWNKIQKNSLDKLKRKFIELQNIEKEYKYTGLTNTNTINKINNCYNISDVEIKRNNTYNLLRRCSLSDFDLYIIEIYNKMDEIDETITDIKNDIKYHEKYCSDLIKENKEELNIVEGKKEELEKQKLEKIRESDYITNFEDIMIISSEIKNINDKIEIIKFQIKKDNLKLKFKNKNYLKEILHNETEIKQELNYIEQELYQLYSNSKKIVDDIEKEAEKERNECLERSIKNEYKKLGDKYFNLAKKNNILGDKYDLYKLSIYFYKNAKNEINISYLDIDIKDIIKRGEQDGLNLNLYKILWNNYNFSEKEKNYNYIKEAIINESKIKYSYLEDIREKLLNYISICGKECENIKEDLEKYEKDYITYNNIDYYKAIGKLKFLDNIYTTLLKQIKSNIDKLKSLLIVKYDISYGINEINKPVDVYMYINIINPFSVNFKDVGIEIDTDEEFNYNDSIYKNINYIISEDEKLKIYLNEIKSNEKKTIILKKNETICYSINNKSEFLGYNNITTENGEISLYCSKKIDNIYVPGNYTNIKIDNILLTSNKVNKLEIKKGKHKIIYKKIWNNLTTIIENKSIEDKGQYLKINVNITIIPKETLKEQVITYQFEENSKDILIYTEDGEAIKTYGKLIKIISIKNLIKNKKTKLIIKYKIDNINNWIEQKINELKNSNLSTESLNILSSITNDTNIEEKYKYIKQIIKIEEKNKKKENEKINKINKEISELNISYKYNNSISNKLIKRINTLEEILGNKNYDKYDESWLIKYINDIKKEQINELNKVLKKSIKLNTNISYKIYELIKQIRWANEVKDILDIEDEINNIKIEIEEENKLNKINETNKIKQIQTINKLIKKYKKLYNSAKNTNYIIYFDLTSEDIEEINENIKKYNNKELNKTINILNKSINNLKHIAENRYKLIKEYDTDNKINYLITKGEYIEALKNIDKLKIKKQKEDKKENKFSLIILTTILAIIGYIIYIIYNKNKKNKPKKLRKLKKFSE